MLIHNNIIHLIVNFGITNIVDTPVTIFSSGSRIAGETFSLMCSAYLANPFPLPSDIPTPTFEWLFNGNASLIPSDVAPPDTVLSSDSRTYSSTLQFSSLSQFHAGRYTCKLGARRLANSFTVTVNGTILL